MTIRRRLTLWYAILLTIIIIIFGAITFGMMRYSMIGRIDNTLRETEQFIRSGIRTEHDPVRDELEFHLPRLDSFYASDVFVQVWTKHDDILLLKSTSDNVNIFETPLDAETIGLQGTYLTNARFQGIDVRVLTRPIVANDQTVGYLQVAGDLSTVNEAIEQLLVVMIISCGFAIIGAVALSLWFTHRALKPIEEITHAAASIAGTDDLRTRLNWTGPADELGRLTSVFNQMMTRLEHLFRVQQRFVADISHELRTPLTSIKGNLELVRRYGMDDESLNAMESETRRMARLVNDLLMLARTDYGGVKMELEPLDLDAIIQEACEAARTISGEADLTIKVARLEPVRIKGNAIRLHQLMTNLLTNAIKFTPDGGEIQIGLENIRDRAVVWVKDTGIGIDEEHINHIFERFYQTDPARTHTGEGFGLGLSVAKWIVNMHEGNIRVSSIKDEGTTFTVTFPIFPPPETDDPYNKPTRIGIPLIRRHDTASESHHYADDSHQTDHPTSHHNN